MRNVLDKSCRENQNTNLCPITFFSKIAVYEIMSENMVEPEVLQKRHNMAHTRCMLHKQDHMHARHAYADAPGDPNVRTRTQINM
jgi:hypothetical protein